MATWNRDLQTGGTQWRESIGTAASGRKQAFRQTVITAAAASSAAHDEAMASIRSRAAADRQSIQTALDAELASADTKAQTELAELDRTVDAKKTDLREKASQREQEAARLGEEEAARVTQRTASNTTRAHEVGAQKIAQYRGVDKGDEITEGIRRELGHVVSRLSSTGRDVAAEVRRKTGDLAGKFRSEAAEGGSKLNQPRQDARNKIIEARDKTKQTLRDSAREATRKIDDEATRVIGDLRTQKTTAAARIIEAADALDGVFDKAARDAAAVVTRQTESITTDLGNALERVREGGWYAPFVNEASAEMGTAVNTERQEVSAFTERVTTAMAQAETGAGAAVTEQAAAIASAVRRLGTETTSAIGDATTGTTGKLRETGAAGSESMGSVRPEVDRELQRNVDEVDARWGEELDRNRQDIRRQVDAALSNEEAAVSRFANSIDPAAARVANASWWEGLLDFVIGVFEGIREAIVDLLKGAWSLLKEPLFWLAVVLVVIVIAVLIVFFGFTLGGILAFLGKALLVIGVIAAVIAAGYYIYLMVTTPNLTWRERGRLFGKAILEIILGFAGTGILKRLGVLAQLGKLRRFISAVGGVRNALRLVRRVGDLDKLIILVGRVGEIEKLILLLDKVGDADRLIALLNKVGNADELLDLLRRIPDAALLLRILTHAKVPNPATLKSLLDTGKIADAGELLRMLDNAKVPNAGALQGLLTHPKIPSGAVLDQLLSSTKIPDAAALRRILDAPKILDAASLQRLLANAKVTDIAALERLLGNVKLPTVVDLERLLAEANISDVGMLERVLANPKVANLAELEALLPLVDNAARLETLLGLADNAVQLADFLTKAGGAAQAANLERLLVGIGLLKGQGSAARAQQLVNQANRNGSKFAEMVDWVARLSSRVNPAPAPPPPAEVASHRFTGGANTKHFLEGHTWEFLEIGKRINKASTTLWPPGTTVGRIMDALGDAIRDLNPTGGSAFPVPDIPLPATGGGVAVQVGTQATAAGPRIGQFFPLPQSGGFITIVKDEMRALFAIFGP